HRVAPRPGKMLRPKRGCASGTRRGATPYDSSQTRSEASRRWWTVVGALALGATACLAPPPPINEVAPPPPSAPTAIVVRADSPERAARQLTLRVRASGCDSVATGSGFAIAPRAFITNRHVITDASEIQVNTWDGRSFEAAVSRVAYYSDLALVVVNGDLPMVGTLSPRDADAGEHVTIVGYPRGGRQTLGTGRVVDYVVGANLGDGTQVMRLTADVEPGNSGGPVLDQHGEVTGVVYAMEVATGHALAIPASAVRSLLHEEPALPEPQGC
ncbi:MAG: S1C family serine protease, partial [Egibacteraceae bacterium]